MLRMSVDKGAIVLMILHMHRDHLMDIERIAQIFDMPVWRVEDILRDGTDAL